MIRSSFIILFLISCFNVSFSQVNEVFENTPLKEVFLQLENNYGVKLAYDPQLIEGITIDTELKNLTAETALQNILKKTELSFDKVSDTYFAIRPSFIEWIINGTIQDSNGIAIPFVQVRIIGSYKGAYANSEGEVNFVYHSDEMPNLELYSLGFRKKIISAEQLSNGASISLEQDIYEFQEVLIEYLTEGISISDDISKITIRPQKMGAVPGTTEPDIFQLVQHVPGINSAASTVSEIQIRGGTADQNHLIWDGIPIYQPGHLNGMISSVNPNIIEKTEIHRGVYDPYYGGKASGLIKLNSFERVPEKKQYGAGFNLIQADVYGIQPLGKKVALMVSGRRSYMDKWSSPTYKSYANRLYQETEILHTGTYSEETDFDGEPNVINEVSNSFVYYDLNGKILYQPNNKHKLSASSIYTSNSLDYTSEFLEESETTSNQVTSTNYGVNIHHDWEINSKLKQQIDLSHANYQYQFNFEVISEEDSVELELLDNRTNGVTHSSVKWKLDYDWNDHIRLSGGYQGIANEVNYTFSTLEEEDSIQENGSEEAITHSAHLNFEFKKTRFLGRIGGRYNYLSSTDQGYYEPRIYGQYKINEWWTWKAAFGQQYQFISQVDQLERYNLGLSNRVWVIANEYEIPVIGSTIFNSGWVFSLKNWRIEIDGYFKNLTNIVHFSNNSALSSGLIRGDATAMGVDFLIKKRWKNFRSWLSYSLSDVKYTFDELATNDFPAPFNQRHSLKWVNTLTWRQFELSTAFKIASGMPYTPFNNVIVIAEDENEEDPENSYAIEYGTFNSRTLPIFHQLDATIFWKFPKNPDKKWKGKIGISCLNIYNRENILSRSYELEVVDEEAPIPVVKPYAIDRNYLGITPNLVARINF